MARIIREVEAALPKAPRRLNVAAYARVSADGDDMVHSLSAQVVYYSKMIQSNLAWRYVGVYADEVRTTGTKADRPEFLRLLNDCRAGKIDMVITKTISRFARNTVTLLETVRELKALGVNIYFEDQNIHSMAEDGEVVLTVLAAYAQEESRSVSENCKWRIRHNFENGYPSTNLTLGYHIHQGDFSIIPEEAAVVQMIFSDYLDGMGLNAIVRKLVSLNIPTKTGGEWNESTIYKILRNEKFAGDLLLQKCFREDHLTKKDRKNRGELPQYLVRNHHIEIVSRQDFERVQQLLKVRREQFTASQPRFANSPFSKKLICGNCGKAYRRKTSLGKASWKCGTFLKLGRAHCPAKQIPEDTLLEVTTSVLGLEQFDEAIFVERIHEIRIPTANQLLFIYVDGTEELRIWEDRSRRDSWTVEMRQQARDREMKRRGEYL